MSQTTFWDINDPNSMSARRATEILWGDAIVQLRANNGEVLVPCDIVTDVIGEANLKVMADRLANIMNKKVHILHDVPTSCYRLVASDDESVTSQGSSLSDTSVNTSDHSSIGTPLHTAGDSSVKIPRPPNCFILYRQAFHNHVKAANPGVSNNEISRILGARWNNESDAVRTKYTLIAERLKALHALKYPDYQYAPRRPHERKRRATRVRNEDTSSIEADPAYVELYNNAQESQDEFQSMSTAEEFMKDLDDQIGFFNPDNVAPIPDFFNESDGQIIGTGQLQNAIFDSMEYSTTTLTNGINLDIHNHEMLVSDLI
ncbi:uncharacterized protein N7529_006310 [Penicillium soppii]|uniref:uncharacterized protein n=1 Tax=Penicillium soppii TaxID=69789 RepID=UPI0025487F7D|nr:uncharacterized protein N7529_006310 [Penicillium soppii]KAJ5864394.1 hypothetical protein N7529_006310 [Penicillium soppii]